MCRKKRWTQSKSIFWELSFENYHPRIILQLLKVTKQRSSIDRCILRIVTRVTISKIVYHELFTKNHYWELFTQNYQLRVIIPKIMYQESFTKIYHIESHLFQSVDNYARLSNLQTSDLLRIIIKSHQTQDYLSRFILQKSSIKSHQSKIIK